MTESIEKLKIFGIFFLILLFGIVLTIAKNQSVDVSYSFSNKTSFEKTLDFSDVLLKVSTDRDAICKYDTSSGISYGNMDGNFDLSSGKLHEKSFTELSDGIYKYYIKCVNGSSEGEELEVIFRVNSLVKAQIVLSEEPPLKAGKIDVSVLTSKIVSQTPSLSYSFDSSVYTDLPLVGSEKTWTGHLIIPDDMGEAVVSFKFKANDLEGRLGEEITSGGAYIIDTQKPKTISDIDATGYDGKIKIEWYVDDDDLREFNIYRSTSPNADYMDFLEDVTESPFEDRAVEKGKTYYYRVSGVDEAGNEGSLSKEVYATVLLAGTSESSSGLDLKLVGRVDNFLTEIGSVIGEAQSIQSSISLKQEKEKNLFSDLELENKVTESISELNSLRKDVEKYKLQDLSEVELTSKINSATLRLNIIKKKIPESLVILDDKSVSSNIGESDIEESVFELNPYISEKGKDKSVEETLKIIEDSGLRVKTDYYVLEIVYLDGTKKELSVVKRKISAELERDENTFFVETIPKDVAETSSEIDFITGNYEVVKEDPVISFESDTKEIIYSFNEKLSINSLEENKLSLVYLFEEDEILDSSITGFYLLDLSRGGYVGVIIGAVLVIALLIYFLYLKKNKKSDLFLEIYKKIEESLDYLEKGNLNKVKEIYSFVKKEYQNLEKKEKEKIYKKIEFLHKKIIVFDLNKNLKRARENKDMELFSDLEKKYNSLSKKFKKQVYNFEGIKKELTGSVE